MTNSAKFQSDPSYIISIKDIASIYQYLTTGTPFSVVLENQVLLGKKEQDLVRGCALPVEAGLSLLFDKKIMDDSFPGLRAELIQMSGMENDPSDERVRTLANPGGFQGTLLEISLLDRSPFETTAESRRRFRHTLHACLGQYR